MGDITDIANSNGEVVASYEYDPWGKVTSVSGSNLEIANLNPFRYRSYYYDSDIQMYYLQSRYYDPEVGRFINCDDVNYIGYSDTANSYNAFAYCENDPVNSWNYNGNLAFRLRWQWTVAIGTLFTLVRVLGISLDIKGINKITNNKIHTALTTALVYSKYYISAEIISFISKTSFAIAMLSTIINLITFMITGPSGSIIKNILFLVASYYIPGLATSIKMIYFGLKMHRGCTLSFGRYGTNVIFKRY